MSTPVPVATNTIRRQRRGFWKANCWARLRRIEELTSRSLSRPRDLAELCLAFEVERRLP
ncbi:hypothetical protein A5641_00220 [Mycobacterium sp. 1554424.7]|nr:hypothetical protein A5641_00220 [Mycobacterium sp. 1554424.7]